MGWLNRALKVHSAKDSNSENEQVQAGPSTGTSKADDSIKRKGDIKENLRAVPKTESSRPPTKREMKKLKKLEKKAFERKQQEKADRIQALVEKSYAHKTRSI